MIIPEDFTTYTEVDPNNRITVVSSKITLSGVSNEEDGFVYKDMGSAFFDGDFSFFFEVESMNGTGGIVIASITNVVGEWQGIYSAGGAGVGVEATQGGPSGEGFFKLQLREMNSGILTVHNSTPLLTGFTYFVIFTRNESVGSFGEIKAFIYSDSSRQTLVDELTVALAERVDFRYVYGVQTHNFSHSGTFFGFIQNFFLELPLAESSAQQGVIFGT